MSMSSQLQPKAAESREHPERSAANDAVEADNAGLEQADSSTKHATPSPSKGKRNAFFQLMSSPHRKNAGQGQEAKRPKIDSNSSQNLSRPGRNGLEAYTSKPASFPPSVVLYHNKDFVVIRDMYPKSSIHLLLLPRTDKDTLHPFTAFQDSDLLAATRTEALKVKTMVAEELRRTFGRFSGEEKARRDAIASGAECELPAGRDWSKEVMIGVHAGPSMNHLHVHIMSRDRVSECMRHRKHYNSFNTSFFVTLEELPLDENDPRWRPDRGGGLKEDLLCWRCGHNFGNKFEKLKSHLAEEFEQWKKE